jgi:hypothetical protein
MNGTSPRPGTVRSRPVSLTGAARDSIVRIVLEQHGRVVQRHENDSENDIGCERTSVRHRMGEGLAPSEVAQGTRQVALTCPGDKGASRCRHGVGGPVGPSSVTRIIDGLVTNGLVERAIDPFARRRVNHTLTHPGEAALRTATPGGCRCGPCSGGRPGRGRSSGRGRRPGRLQTVCSDTKLTVGTTAVSANGRSNHQRGSGGVPRLRPPRRSRSREVSLSQDWCSPGRPIAQDVQADAASAEQGVVIDASRLIAPRRTQARSPTSHSFRRPRRRGRSRARVTRH